MTQIHRASNGTLKRHADFPSQFVAPRHVDVLLPPGYAENVERRYPALYMHDGQNLFSPSHAFGGVDWGVAEAVELLAHTQDFPTPIVVGVWNTPLRRCEYMPQKPFEALPLVIQESFIRENGGPSISDRYLKFLVEELKPFIEARYRTSPGPANTFVMGSSMGGLISLYAISEYPQVFGGVACLSTHWPIGGEPLVRRMAASLPDPASHRLYFDFGTTTLDAEYEPYQRQMDEYLRRAGYVEDQNWMTRKFEGAAHDETAWRARVHIPLGFLLKG